MKKTACMMMALAGAMMLTGCATQTPSLITRQGGNALKPKPQNIAFRVVDTSSAVNRYSADVVSKLEGRLIEERFVALKAGELDMRVLIPCQISIRTSLTEFDQMGDFYVFNAQADATVTAKDETHTLDWGQKQFSVKGARVMGRAAAMRDTTSRLADEVADWVAGGCSAKRDEFTKFRASAAFRAID